MSANCDFFTTKSNWFGCDYWCNVKNDTVSEETYRRFCKERYNSCNCPNYKQYQNGGSYSSGGCLMTTLAHQILGKRDNDPVLNSLRNFRDNILQKNEKYHNVLRDYDDMGAKISDCIMQDDDRVEIAISLYNKMILPIVELINQKEYDKACEKYHSITIMFKEHYGLEYSDTEEYKETDITKLGHGRRRVLKPATI